MYTHRESPVLVKSGRDPPPGPPVRRLEGLWTETLFRQ
jgi:hypothetical protein